MIAARRTWMDRAKCQGDPTPWDAAHDTTDPRVAAQLCAGCPVTRQCLAWALLRGETGVWGATTTDQRKQLRSGVGTPAVQKGRLA